MTVIEEKKRGLGGTDIGALCGVNPYKNAMQVFLDKLGLVESAPETPVMRWGIRLERTIAEVYAEETGQEIERPSSLVHPEHHWVIGHPDFFIRGKRKGLEIKTAGLRQTHFWGEPESDEVPEHYLLQCHWYLMLTDYEEWDLAALLGGQDFRVYHIPRDKELEGELLEIGRKFWFENVLTQTPPPIDSSEAATKYLARRFPIHTEELVRADEVTTALADQLKKRKALLEDFEQLVQETENLLKEKIGDKAGITGEHFKITWKKAKDSQVTDWEAIARALNPSSDLIAKHTKERPGVRRFLPKFSD